MLQQKGPRLRNNQPLVEVTKKAHAPLVRSFQNLSDDSDEHLQHCGQTKTQGMELVGTSLETKPKIQPRFRIEKNPEVHVSGVCWEHPVPLPDRPQHRLCSLHLELCQCDEAIESWHVDDGPPAPRHLLHQEQTAIEAWTGLVHRFQSSFLKHLRDLLP